MLHFRYSLLTLTVFPMLAHAQNHPAFAPKHDTVVTYLISEENPKSVKEVRIFYANRGQEVRLDFFRDSGAERPAGSLIFNKPDDRVFTLLPERKAYLQRDTKGLSNPGLWLNRSMSFAPEGTKTIAGKNCTDWKITSGQQSASKVGSACVTHDGIVLRATRGAPMPGVIQAEAVKYRRLAESLFQPPAGWQRIRSSAPAEGEGHTSPG